MKHIRLFFHSVLVFLIMLLDTQVMRADTYWEETAIPYNMTPYWHEWGTGAGMTGPDWDFSTAGTDNEFWHGADTIHGRWGTDFEMLRLAQNTVRENTDMRKTSTSDNDMRVSQNMIMSQRFQNDAKVAYEKAYGLVLDEDWKNAISAFKEFLSKYGDSPWGDDARFWQCYALEKDGRSPTETFECYRSFVDEYPMSNWADDAKANMIRIGRQLAASGDRRYEESIRSLQADEEERIVITAITALQSMGDDEAAPSLIALYDKSSNAEVKQRIIYSMMTAMTPATMEKLIDIANRDRSDELRKTAVNALGNMLMMADGRIPFVPGWQPFLDNFSDNQWGQYQGQIESMEKMKQNMKKLQNMSTPLNTQRVLQTLKDIALNDQSGDVREWAFITLSMASGEKSVDFIIETARNSKDYTVRRMAIETLGRSSDPRARQVLMDIIKESQK
jgi:hypothetical protein